MKAFLDELEDRLAEAAATPLALRGRDGAPPPRWRRARLRTWRSLAAGVCLAAGTGVVASILTVGTSANLPILGAPPADARALAGKPGVPSTTRFDLAATRVFPTPDGPGHVVSSHDGLRRCIVLPDRRAPGTYGSGCATAHTVDARGLAGEMVEAGHRRRPGRALVAFVLPVGTGADVHLTTPDGAAVPLAIHDGVVIAKLQTEAMLRFQVRGTSREHRFEAPFTDRTVVLQCGDRTVEVRAPQLNAGARTPHSLGNRAALCKRATASSTRG